jgi:glycosyltransferase involved in cell wall biosynthesis
MEKISIIIPAYNEEKRIGRTLDEYGRFFQDLESKRVLNYEILIVINNTQDKTEDIVKSYVKKNKNISYINLKRGGKGYAIIEGFKKALKNDKITLVGFLDADMSTPPKEYYRLILNIKDYEGIIASRYLKGSIVKPKQSFQRIFVSRFFNILVRMLFMLNYRDTQCGAKVFKKEALGRIIDQLGETSWAIDVDLLYKSKVSNLRILEFPTVWSDKSESKLNIKKASIQMFFAVIQLRLINSPFRILIRLLKPVAGFVWRLVR